MIMSTVLVFPHQLFKPHPLLTSAETDEGKNKGKAVLIIEEALFFGDARYPAKFHKQKLLLHRASMRHYADWLLSEGFRVQYVSYIEGLSLKEVLGRYTVGEVIEGLEPTDYLLKKRLTQACASLNKSLKLSPTPNFLNTNAENTEFFTDKKSWRMANFYKHQRTKLNVLLDENNEPQGGKWSFDTENRKKLPKKLIPSLPKLPKVEEDTYLLEAKAYIEKHFANNLGNINNYYYPYTHESAEEWLDTFLEERFDNFGPYEDAIVEGQPWLYHSVLTPMLNIGLLTPKQVLDKTLSYTEKNSVPLASLEGFIRQIIGWREFMCAAYEAKGVTMRTSNYWQHHNAMPKSCYTGTTGIVAIDDTIKRILETGYCHHIERLMVLGGFMFLCEIHPKAIYTWFMELFIDSYDWVMVPNVYAMSQNSAGGLITTKPYFSGSNYIRKMSHYKVDTKDADNWCDVWDGLYWQFILKHSDALAKNPRWSMMVSQARKLDTSKKERIFGAANTFRHKHLDIP